MDHRSGRQDENQGEPFGQVGDRSMRLDKSSKNYLGISAHRSTRLDNGPRECFGLEDQHDYTKLNSKLSSQGGLNRENSLDSRATDQDCDSKIFIRILPWVPWSPRCSETLVTSCPDSSQYASKRVNPGFCFPGVFFSRGFLFSHPIVNTAGFSYQLFASMF